MWLIEALIDGYIWLCMQPVEWIGAHKSPAGLVYLFAIMFVIAPAIIIAGLVTWLW